MTEQTWVDIAQLAGADGVGVEDTVQPDPTHAALKLSDGRTTTPFELPTGETRIDASGIALSVTNTTVQVADKRVMPTGIPIPSGADMNTYTEPGFYSVASFTVARSLLNGPKPEIGGSRVFQCAVVEVTRTASGQVHQKWATIHPTTQTENPVVERRRDELSVWAEWRRTDITGVMSPQRYAGSVGTAAHQSQEGVLKVIASTTEDRGEPWRWIAEPGTLLTVPTHEGSGQSTHPAVLHFPDGWNGWKYWMAHTPYPHSQEAHEDPNIAVSNDGVTWTVPAGLTNPLDDQPGSPGAYNSDTHLAMLPDGRMLLSWRTVDRPNGNAVAFYQRTSSDGINWAPKQVLLRRSLVSQALVRAGAAWRLYGLSGGALVYFESTATLPGENDWTGPITCTTTPPPNGRRWWHGEVQYTGGKWWLVVCDAGETSNGEGNLYLGTSADGVSWNVSPTPLVPKVGESYDSIYKSAFVVRESEIELLYSGYRRDSAEWRLYRAVAKRTSLAGSSDPRTTVRDITAMIQASAAPEVQTGAIWVARVGPMVTLTFQDVILGGGTSWVNLFNLPVGFRPVTDIPSVVYTGDGDQTTTTIRPLIVRASFGRIAIGKVDGMRHRGTVTYVTEDPFPT